VPAPRNSFGLPKMWSCSPWIPAWRNMYVQFGISDVLTKPGANGTRGQKTESFWEFRIKTPEQPSGLRFQSVVQFDDLLKMPPGLVHPIQAQARLGQVEMGAFQIRRVSQGNHRAECAAGFLRTAGHQETDSQVYSRA